VWIAPGNPFRDTGETSRFRNSSGGFEITGGESIPKSLDIRAAPDFRCARGAALRLSSRCLPMKNDDYVRRLFRDRDVCAFPSTPRGGPGLVAVVAEEHRTSRASPGNDGLRKASRRSSARTAALPGASRAVAEDQVRVLSAFCRVPAGFLVRAAKRSSSRDLWNALQRPSRKRRALESGAGTESLPLESPPIERTVSYKQRSVTSRFLVAALWLGFDSRRPMRERARFPRASRAKTPKPKPR